MFFDPTPCGQGCCRSISAPPLGDETYGYRKIRYINETQCMHECIQDATCFGYEHAVGLSNPNNFWCELHSLITHSVVNPEFACVCRVKATSAPPPTTPPAHPPSGKGGGEALPLVCAPPMPPPPKFPPAPPAPMRPEQMCASKYLYPGNHAWGAYSEFIKLPALKGVRAISMWVWIDEEQASAAHASRPAAWCFLRLHLALISCYDLDAMREAWREL